MSDSTVVDKRSAIAAAFIKDTPKWSGGVYPTSKELGHNFQDDYLMLWNHSAIFYGVRTNMIPARVFETDAVATGHIVYMFNEFEKTDYRACGAFPIDALRSTVTAQRKAASIAKKRRVRGGEFWKPFLVNDRPGCVAGFDPDLLMLCYALLGEKEVALRVPLYNQSVLPILLTSPLGKIYVLPVRT